MKRWLFSLLIILIAGFWGLPVFPEERAETLANYVDQVTGMEFVFVKGGCFRMGDVFGDGEEDERPVHEVCVSDFYMGKYEVTQAQWEKVMNENPSSDKTCGPNCPVESISYISAQKYIKRLNSLSGKEYRLPTEAEWEYAARSGGKEEKWSGTNDDATLKDYAWYNENAETRLHKVGLKKPNGLGIHDMSGNVIEWCLDGYQKDFYKKSPKKDPVATSLDNRYVLRGGSISDKNEVRTTKRFSDPADTVDGTYGFRLVLPVK